MIKASENLYVRLIVSNVQRIWIDIVYMSWISLFTEFRMNRKEHESVNLHSESFIEKTMTKL